MSILFGKYGNKSFKVCVPRPIAVKVSAYLIKEKILAGEFLARIDGLYGNVSEKSIDEYLWTTGGTS